ncbi:rhodanese-like domain-containing protein 4, chloroplastic isoform X2 [Malania oleifera]|uniref:rhodanese-like domain-containing protein 4, chloroplastic isoform X2 n=1 Tax=Malania oleifera TaxID=397392 RepID=UPI0025ADA4A9|nr:rhodanese-like domain-containing protein 4, chloroplastic isoform X2 [Malania oleifera]
MEALNTARLTPISVLCDRRTDPRKISSSPTNSPLKFPNSITSGAAHPSNLSEGNNVSRSFHGGLVLLSSVLNGGLARALTYDEALEQSAGTSTFGDPSSFDISGVFDSVVNFGVENPAIVAGGAAVLAVTLVLSQILKSPKPWGVESAKTAYANLGDDANSQLLDIRAPVEIRKVGSPDIRGLKKKPVSIVYKGGDKPGFLKKLALRFKEPEKTKLFILDKFDGNSELVAELVTSNGFKAAYAIKDGAEGARGWMNSGLPWLLPKKNLSLDLGNLSDTISSALGEGFDALPVTFGIAAAAGFGVLAFTEVETVLQVLGSVALAQFVSKKLLFAEDRKETVQQFDEFLNTKVGPKELVGEIKQIGKALLPSPVTSKALPAPAEASSGPATVTELNTGPNVQAVAKPIPEINSVPKTEVKEESHSGLSRPLSPYPYYPDFKPPTSPTPSQP